MPLLWGKTRCKETSGWEDRIAAKLIVAGSAGAAVGSVLSVLQQQPLVRFTAASTASFLMLAGCFSVVQEASRLVRCRDSPANSVLAGAAAGALLYKTHGRSGAPGAVICAALGGAVHLLADKIQVAGGFAQLLVSMDLLDPPPQPAQPPAEAEQQQSSHTSRSGRAEGAAAAAAAGQAGQPPAARPWWHKYLPIKKMSDEEWERYKSQQDAAQRKRIEAALAGGLPVMVDRQRQQQEQQDGSSGS
ncbi:hypothetical protein ABPG75_001910 [Micractinium tetrahymenae]